MILYKQGCNLLQLWEIFLRRFGQVRKNLSMSTPTERFLKDVSATNYPKMDGGKHIMHFKNRINDTPRMFGTYTKHSKILIQPRATVIL